VDAVVLEVAKRNVGSVADEAEALVTLVPLDAPLEVEVEVRPEDIGYVRVGQTARVKLSTLPFQKHGKIDAEVLAVSEDAFLRQTPAGEQSFYRARLKLPPDPLAGLRNLPQGFAIMPGMTVSGEINVGDRRIIEYFLYPILAGFDQSLREPR
ncbi:HlyD family efflux transporter periplasmic adaptor subunit, partial [uncultured Desulfovibrio sp.]